MYGEVIIGVNMLFNYAILSFANKVGTAQVHRGRLLFASFIGGIPVALFSTSLFAMISSFFVMTVCAFGKRLIHWKQSVFIVLIAGVFAGGVLTVIQDRLYAQSGYKAVFIYAVLAFISLYLFKLKWLDVRLVRRESELTAESVLSIWGADIPITVFVDSGNNCTEPLSDAPVHFVAVQKVAPFIPNELRDPLFTWDAKKSMTLADFPEVFLPNIRLIKLFTVQGNAWAVGYKFESWEIEGGELLKPGYIVFTKEKQRFPNGAEAILHVSAMDALTIERGTAYVA